MKTESLDSIVRECLQDVNLPMHYYVRFLNFAKRGLKEFNYDFPLNIKSVQLTVNSYNAIVLPTDYVDYVEVSVKYGDKMLPLAEDDRINPLNNFDTSGNKIQHPSPQQIGTEEIVLNYGGGSGNHINVHGEHKGRRFGMASEQRLTFKVVPERAEIQFDVAVDTDKVVLVYISDGHVTTEANVVNPYAVAALKAYVLYERAIKGKHSVTDKRIAAAELKKARRNLSARINSLSIHDILRSIRRGLHASIHN